jgi:guanosine-3',5'-bis(diphosphate) 3'-pyrophosphohydrolase
MNTIDDLVRTVHFAAEKHRNQRRKNAEQTPYINHPIHVMTLLSEAGVTDVPTLQAAVLHDTIEDTDTTRAEIDQNFGHKVASIVSECTDDKSLGKVARKKMQIDHARTISREAKLVKLADKLSNLSSLRDDPPAQWSKEVIRGYFLWSYLVCEKIFDVNRYLTDRLLAIFESQEITKMTDRERKEQIEEYYCSIDPTE